MKISIKPIVIAGNRRKDGTWGVSIRVTFKGVSRRLPTALVCTASDLTRTCKIKSPAILAACERLVARMRDTLQNISPFDLERMDVDSVVEHIRAALSHEDFRLDFFAFADEYLQTKKPGTRGTYLNAVHAFARFLGEPHIDINEINSALLLDFLEFVKTEPKARWNTSTQPKVTGPTYIYKLNHIFKAAKDRYNDEDTGVICIPRSPFSKVRPGKVYCNGQECLPVEVMQKVIEARSDDPKVDMALAAFVLSFGTMGANLADLYAARGFKGEEWRYNRLKTRDRREDKAEMRVVIQPEMRPYLERLGAGTRSEWWLPSLHARDADKITYTINRALTRWCKAQGVQRFTFYAARHTFATVARRLGVEKATVDEALAHKGDFEIADIYAERAWDVINAANRVTIDHFRWPSTDGATLPENIVNQR